MKKFFRFLSVVSSVLCVGVFVFVIYGNVSLPDAFRTNSDGQIVIAGVYRCGIDEYEASRVSADSKMTDNSQTYRGEYSFLGIVPVKESAVTVSDREYVAAGGDLIGIRIYTKGVVVVSSESVNTADGSIDPCMQAGLCKGDIILNVDGQDVNSSSELNACIALSGGEAMEIEYERDGKVSKTKLTPVYSETENKYRCGLWVRDSTAGIGTVTYYDVGNSTYGALGHGICDSDTDIVLPVGGGDILDAVICECVKGQKGTTGEIRGSFGQNVLGTLDINCDNGIYGSYNGRIPDAELLPVAEITEVKQGAAQIISTLENGEKEYYDIEIQRVNCSDSATGHDMTIKVTDPDLIEKSGGIIQGMSGSPIIQNGMLVGAVTHVFLNDPQYGYGIFARTMLDISDGISSEKAA